MTPTTQGKTHMVLYNLRLAQHSRRSIRKQLAGDNPQTEDVANIYALCHLAISALVEAMKLARRANLEHAKVVGEAIKAALARSFKDPSDEQRLNGSELLTVLLKMGQAFSDQLVNARVYAIQTSMNTYTIAALDAAIAFTLGLLGPTHGGEKDALRVLYHGLLTLRDSKRPQPAAGTQPLDPQRASEPPSTKDVVVEAAKTQLTNIFIQEPFMRRHADEAENMITGLAEMLGDKHADVLAWRAQLTAKKQGMTPIAAAAATAAT